MTVKEAINLFQCHQRSSVRERTLNSYAYPLQRFRSQYGERQLESFTPDELFTFLENLTQHHARSTRRLRYAQIKSFFLCGALHKKNDAECIVMRRKGSR